MKTEEILDNQQESERKGKFNWTVWVGSLFILYGLIGCQQNGIITDNAVLLTLVLFVISILGNILRPRLGAVITTLIFTLGVFKICQFFPTQESFGMGIGNFMISFEIYSLFLLIGHVVLTSKSHQEIIKLIKNKQN